MKMAHSTDVSRPMVEKFLQRDSKPGASLINRFP
jgi:hypothetical protein